MEGLADGGGALVPEEGLQRGLWTLEFRGPDLLVQHSKVPSTLASLSCYSTAFATFMLLLCVVQVSGCDPYQRLTRSTVISTCA